MQYSQTFELFYKGNVPPACHSLRWCIKDKNYKLLGDSILGILTYAVRELYRGHKLYAAGDCIMGTIISCCWGLYFGDVNPHSTTGKGYCGLPKTPTRF